MKLQSKFEFFETLYSLYSDLIATQVGDMLYLELLFIFLVFQVLNPFNIISEKKNCLFNEVFRQLFDIAQFPTLILKVPFLSVEIAPISSFFVIM